MTSRRDDRENGRNVGEGKHEKLPIEREAVESGGVKAKEGVVERRLGDGEGVVSREEVPVKGGREVHLVTPSFHRLQEGGVRVVGVNTLEGEAEVSEFGVEGERGLQVGDGREGERDRVGEEGSVGGNKGGEVNVCETRVVEGDGRRREVGSEGRRAQESTLQHTLLPYSNVKRESGARGLLLERRGGVKVGEEEEEGREGGRSDVIDVKCRVVVLQGEGRRKEVERVGGEEVGSDIQLVCLGGDEGLDDRVRGEGDVDNVRASCGGGKEKAVSMKVKLSVLDGPSILY